MWTADVDCLYLGANFCLPTSAAKILVTTDPTITQAVFVAPTVTAIVEGHIDYLENSQQVCARITGAKNVFLTAGTQLRIQASAQAAVLVYIENNWLAGIS